MPTVDRLKGLRFVIYPNDHRPGHVHVIGSGREAVFNLSHDPESVTLRENHGFSLAEVRDLATFIAMRHVHLLSQWERIHGHSS
jgi:Domain of unknown function (DUF4160)